MTLSARFPASSFRGAPLTRRHSYECVQESEHVLQNASERFNTDSFEIRCFGNCRAVGIALALHVRTPMDRVVPIFCGCVVASVPVATRTPDAGPPPDQSPITCAYAWPELRQKRDAYDHVVHVQNACQTAITCDVSTDANPNPIRIGVPATEGREVVTARGTAVRKFEPRVDCRRS